MTSYRDVRPPTTNSSDDSGSDTNSDSDDDQPWKRRKTTSQSGSLLKKNRPPEGLNREDIKVAAFKGHGQNVGPNTIPCGTTNAAVKRPKRNNVWGEVVQKQNEDHVAQEMDGFDMELSRNRDVESYNYRLGREENVTRVALGAPCITKPHSLCERELKPGLGESADDCWLANRHKHDADGGIQRPVHQRLGEKHSGNRKTAKARQGSRPRSECSSPMKFIPISPSLSRKEIVGKLAFSLQESKRELMTRVVDTIGVEKSLELWKLTADTEKNGGMMVLNGTRRRSPGGVFLYLMKTDPQVTPQQVAEIFADEKKKEIDLKRKKDRRRRKQAAQSRDKMLEEAAATAAATKETVEEEGMDGGKRSNLELGEIGSEDSADDKTATKDEQMD